MAVRREEACPSVRHRASARRASRIARRADGLCEIARSGASRSALTAVPTGASAASTASASPLARADARPSRAAVRRLRTSASVDTGLHKGIDNAIREPFHVGRQPA